MNKELDALILRKNALEAELSRIIKEQKKEPEGSLKIRGGRKNYRYYLVVNKDNKVKRTYIRQKDWKIATALAKKRYNKIRRREIELELQSLDAWIQNLQKQEVSSHFVLHHQAGYSDLLLPVMNPELCKARLWSNEPFTQNTNHPEYLRFKTKNGLKVRSKSEVFIVNCLLKHNIPFRYESQLVVGNSTFYPDFTIYLPKDDRLIIWEHFGMADDPDYREKMNAKMRLYFNHGYVPGYNMICSYETKKVPLSEEYIETLIEAYLK